MMNETRQLYAVLQGHVLNVAMIFATSTPLIDGLSGSVTKAGQKKILIYLRAKPHYQELEMSDRKI